MARPIVHYEIPANDVEKLRKFYEECFGWKFSDANMPGMEYWMFSSGKDSLGGGMYKKQDANERPRNYVHVESVDGAVVTFQQAGGSIVTTKQEVPGVGFIAMGLDQEGNLVGLFEPHPPAQKKAVRKKGTKSRTKSKGRKR